MRNTWREEPCPVCHGKRLKPEALAVTVGGKNLYEVSSLSITDARAFFQSLTLTEKEQHDCRADSEGNQRAHWAFSSDVGLGYLTLARAAGSLSGGEAQRIRLATQIGSALMGVLYILDEPSIGLHQRDNTKLIATLEKPARPGQHASSSSSTTRTRWTRRTGSSTSGPGAGIHGGSIVAQGTRGGYQEQPGQSITGAVPLRQRGASRCRRSAAQPNGAFLTVRGAKEHNLKNIDVNVPARAALLRHRRVGFGQVVSSVNEILYQALGEGAEPRENPSRRVLTASRASSSSTRSSAIDQSPIGRTPRARTRRHTPGCSTRSARCSPQTPEAKARGYKSRTASPSTSRADAARPASGDGAC